MGTGYLFHLVLSRKVSFNNVSLEKVLSRTVRRLFIHYNCDFLVVRAIFTNLNNNNNNNNNSNNNNNKKLENDRDMQQQDGLKQFLHQSEEFCDRIETFSTY